jgi:[ribosomal protein S5]-alanine N-acetyltransferase
MVTDEVGYREALSRSRDFISEWNPLGDSAEDFRVLLATQGRAEFQTFLVIDQSSEDLVGRINVANVLRGRLQSASLSYDAFLPYAGTGRMAEGMRLVIGHCFRSSPGGLDLHRLDISIQPANDRSIQLAQRLGFWHEGKSPGLLFLDGAWRDHERFAVTREYWDGSLPPSGLSPGSRDLAH